MTLSSIHHPLFSLIAGLLILIMPRLLNFIVAIYLIGIVGLIRFIGILLAFFGGLIFTYQGFTYITQ
jgi:hypothetical protein